MKSQIIAGGRCISQKDLVPETKRTFSEICCAAHMHRCRSSAARTCSAALQRVAGPVAYRSTRVGAEGGAQHDRQERADRQGRAAAAGLQVRRTWNRKKKRLSSLIIGDCHRFSTLSTKNVF